MARVTHSAPGAIRIADLWTRRLLRRVDAAVCASEFAADELRGFASGAGLIGEGLQDGDNDSLAR